MAGFWVWRALRAVSLATLVAGPARAQDGAGCPPGDWFCDDEAEPPLPPESTPEGERLPPDEPERDPGPPSPPPPGMLPPRMDLTSPPPRASEYEGPPSGPVSPWSVSMRLQGLILGASGNDAAMGGVGASVRYAFHPHLVLDLGFDSFGGTDYNGYDRNESSLGTSLLVFLNPDKAVRTYVLMGLHVSAARVDVFGELQDWVYVGGHGGLGLDIPVHERVSLAVDFLGFLRGRTDSRAEREPEFTDGYGYLTNTSGGGLLRAGVTIYW